MPFVGREGGGMWFWLWFWIMGFRRICDVPLRRGFVGEVESRKMNDG